MKEKADITFLLLDFHNLLIQESTSPDLMAGLLDCLDDDWDSGSELLMMTVNCNDGNSSLALSGEVGKITFLISSPSFTLDLDLPDVC